MSGVDDYFERRATQWVDDAYRDTDGLVPIGVQRIRQVREIIEKRYPNSYLDICDLGCGGGDLCRALVALGHRLTGVDRSGSMLEISRSHKGPGNIEFVFSPIENANDHLPSHKFELKIF